MKNKIVSIIIISFIILINNISFGDELGIKDLECSQREIDICKVEKVIDGDTFKLHCVNRYPSLITVRLKNIDVFESYNNSHLKKQKKKTLYSEKDIIKYGIYVKNELKKKLNNKIVILVLDDNRKGFFGRYLGDIYFINKKRNKLIKLDKYIETRFNNYIIKN